MGLSPSNPQWKLADPSLSCLASPPPFQQFLCVCVCVCVSGHFSCVQLFVSLWTVAHQAPQSMGFSRQEYWSGLPFLPPGDLPDSGIEPVSPVSPALAGGFFTTSTAWETLEHFLGYLKKPFIYGGARSSLLCTGFLQLQ